MDNNHKPFAVGLKVTSYNWLMRRARLDKGYTQQHLADLAGIPVQVAGSLETLRLDYKCDWDVLDRIAHILEQPVNDLFPAWLQPKVVKGLTTGDIPIPLTETTAIAGPDAIQSVMQRELREALQLALKSLPTTREQRVLSLHFGLEDGGSRTFEEIAKMMGVTRGRIMQIEAKALRNLRHPKRSKALAPFLSELS